MSEDRATARTAPLLQFPCAFPLKVVGRAGQAFELAVREIVLRHLGEAGVVFSVRPSGRGTYVSITATFTATSRAQLDALYRELNGHELVVMTL